MSKVGVEDCAQFKCCFGRKSKDFIVYGIKVLKIFKRICESLDRSLLSLGKSRRILIRFGVSSKAFGRPWKNLEGLNISGTSTPILKTTSRTFRTCACILKIYFDYSKAAPPNWFSVR